MCQFLVPTRSFGVGRKLRLATLSVMFGLLIEPGVALASVGLCPLADRTDGPPVLGFGPDDLNCSVISPAIAESAPGSVVQAVMNRTTFGAAQRWIYLPAADLLAANLNVTSYFAWVVDSPDVTSPDGRVYNRRLTHLDVGGAAFTMEYTQHAGQPTAAAIHFLQIYSEQLDGGPVSYHVDNADNADSPFYDQVAGAAVERHLNGTAWFMDTPYECENRVVCRNEGTEHHFAEYHFGVYVAVQTDTPDGADVNHQVTLYAGKQWGFKYSTVDFVDVAIPEPPGLWLLAGLLLALTRFGHQRRYALLPLRLRSAGPTASAAQAPVKMP